MKIINLSAFISVKRIYYKIASFVFKGSVDYDINRGFSLISCYQFTTQIVGGKQLPAISLIISKVVIDP